MTVRVRTVDSRDQHRQHRLVNLTRIDLGLHLEGLSVQGRMTDHYSTTTVERLNIRAMNALLLGEHVTHVVKMAMSSPSVLRRGRQKEDLNKVLLIRTINLSSARRILQIRMPDTIPRIRVRLQLLPGVREDNDYMI